MNGKRHMEIALAAFVATLAAAGGARPAAWAFVLVNAAAWAGHASYEKKWIQWIEYAALLCGAVFVCVDLMARDVGAWGFAPLACVAALAGAILPDADAWVSMRSHRDPFTHSAAPVLLVAANAAWLAANGVFDASPAPLLVFAGVLVGYGSHLVADVVPSGSLLLDAARELVAGEGAPGDVRGIPERMERWWLLTGGALGLALGYLVAWAVGDASRATVLIVQPAGGPNLFHSSDGWVAAAAALVIAAALVSATAAAHKIRHAANR